MSHPRYVVLDKEVGHTPLQTIQAWKELHPEYAHLPASYAGRLDPMASGLLLVLLGEECKKQEKYHGLDKEYEIEVLLDIGSDTGDVLGIVSPSQTTNVPTHDIRTVLRNEEGSHMREYPVFSSKTVGGVPLFLHALQGSLDTISIPQHLEIIYKIRLVSMTTLSTEELRTRVDQMLSTAPKTTEPSKALGADFRIEAVRTSWDMALTTPHTYTVIRLQVSCASGSYMRTLAGRIGAALGTHALALSIRRTRIGRVVQIGSFALWTSTYPRTTH